MPTSQGISAFGTLLKLGDGGYPEGFATVAEVTNITGPGAKTTMVTVSQHGSPGGFIEKRPSMIDPGTYTITVNFTPTAVTQGYNFGLLNAWINRVQKDFQLVWPNTAGTYVQFAAYVTKFDQKDPVDGKLEATFDLEVTGPYSWSN